MENTKNKNMWIGIVIVLVIVLGLVFWSMNKAAAPVVNDSTSLPAVNDNALSVTENPVEDTSTGSEHATSPAVTISYANALIKYKDARIQINTACQATPNNMTFKNGTSIMIDNRSPSALTIKAGSVFAIKAYGFKIVKLSSATLPATWLVDCGTSQNVATILIQK